MMFRRKYHLLNGLLILMLFIFVIHRIFTAYCPFKHRPYSRQSLKYEKRIKTGKNNGEQIVDTFVSVKPNRRIKSDEIEKLNLPWYFKDGTRVPNKAKVSPLNGKRISRLWPEEEKDCDRVEEQLMFIPPNYEYENTPIKYILLYNGLRDWMVDDGQDEFLSNDCPVNRCAISFKQKNFVTMDAVLFRDELVAEELTYMKSENQVYILYNLQSAYNSDFNEAYGLVNWTATYRHDSDIVVPYGRWAYFDPSVTQVEQLNKDYSQNKTKQVAMIITNCDTDNNRLLYAIELGKYISVDVYGECDGLITVSDNFLQILDQDYKFYLAFETSNCIDYVTEKFFINGLQHNVLPVAMGGRPEDYERIAPRWSYLHVDDYDSPKDLAEHLYRLDVDDDLYNEYFRWKGTGEFIDDKFFCRMCAMLHDDEAPAKHYPDMDRWWRQPETGVCDHSTEWLNKPPVE